MASLPCSDIIHQKLKEYCKNSGQKLKDVVDDAIKRFLEEKGWYNE